MVTEVSGDVVVQRTKDTGNFAKALSGHHRAGHYHNASDHQNDGRYTQNGQSRSGKDHPPGDLLPDGVHDLAPLELFHEADGHTGEDLDKAQSHGRR